MFNYRQLLLFSSLFQHFAASIINEEIFKKVQSERSRYLKTQSTTESKQESHSNIILKRPNFNKIHDDV